ncbi:MAG: hypothetical protein PHC28_06685 [Flavobacterium sp.]|uniref:hypothetical protein n=1 Tax=Flavobacterium sp. TaxID=239 RepID=UPI0026143621|nr:hypothetical protein [Flavobacterium sp.]MDD5150156.1 hypothetical protein [Flavobacterium sp.]
MGLFKSISSSYFDNPKPDIHNPDPLKYRIKKYMCFNGYLIIDINYPNCLNYEGNKILIYKGISINDLIDQKYIDPHFSDNNKYHSPFARFEPTNDGWDTAIQFIKFQGGCN